MLLALICASLLLTAIVVQRTYTPTNNLKQAAETLEDALQQKEDYINSFLTDSTKYNFIKRLSKNEHSSIAFIDDLTNKKRIWLTTIYDGKITFWSGIKILPENEYAIKEGRSFIKRDNGYYEAIRHTDGKFTAVFFIPVKSDYKLQNKYLQNIFEPQLTTDRSLELADFTDKNVYNVHSIDHKYLFSLKQKPHKISHQFWVFETVLWILTFLFLCLFINMLCNYLARIGHLGFAILSLIVFIILLRFVNIYFHWPGYVSDLDIFDSQYYYGGAFFPSLGDLCVNLAMLCWLASFIYSYRFRLAKPVHDKAKGYFIIVAVVAILFISLTGFVSIFYDLIVNSNINFDVNNVLGLSAYSYVGMLMICVAFLIFGFVDEMLLVILSKIKIPVKHTILIFVAGVIIATILSGINNPFSIFYIIAGAIILIRGYVVWYRNAKLSAASFIAIIILSAFLASVKLNYFQKVREHENRKTLMKKLEAADDPNADMIFRRIDKQIVNDPYLIKYLLNKDHPESSSYLRIYFKKNYFDGYLSKYDFKIYEFNTKGLSLSDDKHLILDNFKDMVLYSAFKVSNYFYRENDSFGFQSYFGLLPIYYNNQNLGTFVIALKSKPLQYTNSFPELLVDSRIKMTNDLKDYSYAFYSDNMLLSQSGQYVYSLKNNEFNAPAKQFAFKTTTENNAPWYHFFTNYNHLVYRVSSRRVIVLSKPEFPIIYGATSLAFFFVFILLFNAIVMAVRWIWGRLKLINIEGDEIKWTFRLNLDRILYKTRIQFSMIFAVVVTMIFVGIITYLSITTQYQEQQDASITERITRIASAFENHIDEQTDFQDHETQVTFNAFADAYSTDLSLFDRNGKLLYTTQPKIYSQGLLRPRMNASAFIYLNKLQKSEYVNKEQIGNLRYKSGYAPIRNSNNETIAFLQLPFFSNEAEYTERIGSLLNAMINVYALVFIFIGIFAIVVAQQITAPLSFIQHTLSRTIYGRKNEPIIWRRNDEIGALVREYNNMIAALENSANKLAQSERESAWREMAKQVAHEIKNPLTPLKLGLQLLEKSWKDNDPKFNSKFERFSKSFVEQIESLSQIASEFSAFAKMPETRMQRLDVFDMLMQAVTIFKQMDGVSINMETPDDHFFIIADRDQLLRCFNNLLKNAIEAIPPGRPGEIDINYTITHDAILIKIQDNGNGIPEDLRTKIFEPNFTTKSSGTGLGLAFVKNSIENAGGKVWFETELEKGTTFYLNLPKAKEQ